MFANMEKKMQVVKRNGNLQDVSFDKITKRISYLTNGLNVNSVLIAQKTINSMYNKISTIELDIESAKICANMSVVHPDYNQLGANILISNLHKLTHEDYGKVLDQLYNNYETTIEPNFQEFNMNMIDDLKMESVKKHIPLISKELYVFGKENIDEINKMFVYDRDYTYDFFAFKTLERAYLLKKNGVIIERPQHMLMRVALGHYIGNIKMAKKMYDDMSNKLYTPATPTLYNCGTIRQQCSSCFVLGTDDDMDDIYKTISDCARISKNAGGIGVSISNIRGKGSLIRGTNGTSNGIVPMIQVYNQTARYVDQGGGKRKGAIALYLEPWHVNIFEFLDLKKNIGAETERARDVFLGLWVPDLFMERIKQDGVWSLMCPDKCKGLTKVYGKQFEKLYTFYEENEFYVKQIKARDLFNHILAAQNETGVPYMMYKDSVNRKTNHQNIGTIQGSNLCAEIAIYFDKTEYSVCTLASIGLPKFVEEKQGEVFYNYKKLAETAGQVTRNLNRVIDINYYPTEEARISTMNHRPLGIGVQGLADVFAKMGISFESEKAREVNVLIFESIYYGALKMSCELAKIEGPYKLFDGSPFSKGILQFDMWIVKPTGLWDWASLKQDIKQYGTRNSLLTALMPTASTGQILGNSAAFEPYTSNLYLRKTSAGNFIVINKYLIKELIKLGMWDDTMKQTIMYYKGSIQKIKKIPKYVKDMFKTASEIKQKVILDMAIDRSPYIDQTQSMNIFMDHVNTTKLRSIHFYGWEKGLKTGMYYLRSKPIVDAAQFSLDQNLVKQLQLDELDDIDDEEEQKNNVCKRNVSGDYVCEACT